MRRIGIRRRTALVAAAVSLGSAVLAGCSSTPPGAAPPTPTAPPTTTPTTTPSASVASGSEAVSTPNPIQPLPTTPPPVATTNPAAPTPSMNKSTQPGQAALPPAELRRLQVPSASFDQRVSPLSSVAMGGAIDPPVAKDGKPSLPVRVSDKGVQPSSSADDTVYVGCHTSDAYGPDAYPCDVLIRSVKAGDKIVATTDAGTLTYVVSKTRSIVKEEFADDDETWRVQPKRMVLVMCDIVGGTGNHHNWVIYADLAA